jgi:hypothetical protein
MSALTLNSLMADYRLKNVFAERKQLVEKWNKTGLLKNLDGVNRMNMAQILENQAVQLLKESGALSTGGGSLTSSGQIAGFTAQAFPIIRRAFGGLVSNELVSVQPMSLPSGLIFYLDYTYGSNVGGDAGLGLSNSSTVNAYGRGQSIYNNPTGKGVQSGSLNAGGMYGLAGTGYSRVHSGSKSVSGLNANLGAWTGANSAWVSGSVVASASDFSGSNARFVNFEGQIEADLMNGVVDYTFAHITVAAIQAVIPNADLNTIDQLALFGVTTLNSTVQWGEQYQGGTGVFNLRRLNKRGDFSGGVFTPNPLNGAYVQFVLKITNGGTAPSIAGAANWITTSLMDSLSVDSTNGSTVTIPSYETDFGSTPSPAIPEIDIKIEAIPISAESRKLRARWSPELAQDLSAYQALDAEVELTTILSEQLALEIDREILNEILTVANGANFYWSRAPGVFVNKITGEPKSLASSLSIGPSFQGNTVEWYQTLIETIIDVANTIHKKTLRGSANFIVCGPDVATILESSMFYKSKISFDSNGQAGTPHTIGAEAIGTVSNRFTVYKDPYFPGNKILVGYRGGSYLETGYVYAPYVPIIMTPVIFGTEDFSPRRGIMTRFGHKVVRSDFYGTVTCLNMNYI